MKRISIRWIVAVAFVAVAGVVHADDIEGVIEQVDASNRTLTVKGITFFTTPTTDYDDGLKRFEDLRVGQKVEVDFDYRDGRHIATEIELED